MRNIFRRAGWVLAIGALAATGFAAEKATDDYVREIETWKEQRTAQLLRADGWLSLVGLHFLEPDENTVGTDPDNSIVIAKGPEHWATLTLTDDGRVNAKFDAGLGVKVDGEEVLGAELKDDVRTRPSEVTLGSMSFIVIERGGKKALRVRDADAERRAKFAGLEYYPIDPAWRIEADWVLFDRPRSVPIRNTVGDVSPAMILGKVVFKRDGQTIELLPIQEDPEGVLFFVISDRTSGTETYEAARFLYASPPVDGKVILDFNRAQNPPCAFTPFATCPLPAKENQMSIAVTAGEKKYRGPH